MPLTSQVAAIWLNHESSIETSIRDIVVHTHSGSNHKVKYYSGCYDPLQYPLLFPYGDIGWHENIERINIKKGKNLQHQQWIDPHKLVLQILRSDNEGMFIICLMTKLNYSILYFF